MFLAQYGSSNRNKLDVYLDFPASENKKTRLMAISVQNKMKYRLSKIKHEAQIYLMTTLPYKKYF